MTAQLPLNTMPLPLRLRVEDYLALDRIGAFEDYAKTELIGGEIFFMNAQHRRHASTKMKLYDALRDALGPLNSRLVALVEASIEIPDHSVPEPDIVLTSEPEGEGLVPLASVALVAEIADTSLAQDLGRKAVLYAQAGIAEYWVVDINDRVIHQLWSPQGEDYAGRRVIAFGQSVTAETIDGLAVETARI